MSKASQEKVREQAGLQNQLVEIALVFAAYFIAGKLGQSTSNIRSGNLGPVWPAYGVTLAAFILYGYRIWVGIAAAALVVALWSPASAAAAAVQAAATTLAGALGLFLLRRVNFHRALNRLQDAIALITVGAFGSALISASIGTLVLYATNARAYSGVGRAWLIYWLGDSTGVLLITPLILTLPELRAIRSWRAWAELGTLLLLVGTVTAAIFGDSSLLGLRVHVLAFAVLPFVMWAALRFRMCGAAMATLMVAGIGTVATAFGSGPFAHNSPFANAALLDVFFTVLSVSGMVLAAVIGERERARREHEQVVRDQAASEVRLRLATIVESSDDAIIGVDLGGTITDWNKGAEALYGYSRAEAIGRPIFMLMPPECGTTCHSVMDRVRQGTAVRHHETVRIRKDGTRVEVSLTGSPVFGAGGQVVRLSSIERDIGERKRQEEILRNSEERFRLAAQAAKMFAYEWDVKSDMIVRSGNSSNILGIDDSVPLTGKQADAMVHPDDRKRFDETMAELTPEHPYLSFSYRIVRADQTVIWLDVHRLAHFDDHGRLVRIVGMKVDITERKKVEEALANARRRVIEAQETERTRIARELHDDIGQRLALLTVQLEQLERRAPDLGIEQANLSELRQQALKMARDIQSLSHELHSARLEYLGIAAAAQGLCRDLAEKQNVEVECKIHDLPGQLEPQISLCLFRVLQEALNNSLKHSGAGHFEVSLWATAEEINLRVSDSGAGFDGEVARSGQGMGLISMEERVKLLNGEFSVKSQKNRGTTIHARIPFPATSQSALAAG